MKVYKIIFARNEVVSCRESTTRLPGDTDIRYEQSNGQLIYAFVQAEDLPEAVSKAKQLVPKLATQMTRPHAGDPYSAT